MIRFSTGLPPGLEPGSAFCQAYQGWPHLSKTTFISSKKGAATKAAPAFFIEASLHLHLEDACQRVTRLLHHGVHNLRANTHK
jgi:hypothetical protein